MDRSQTRLLRIAAFLVDALAVSLILIVPGAAISYGLTWSGSPRGIQLVWWAALAMLMLAMLFRDGYRGRSMGKQLLGLRLLTPTGDRCGWLRSFARNFPLIVPGWNLLEVILVLFGRARTGDRIARTQVTEE